MFVIKMYLKYLLLFVIILNVHCKNRTFPMNFKFGLSSSAYQIEGAWNKDGKSANIWDVATHQFPHWTTDSKNADIACNSYELWREDVEILKELRVNYYRFSISWSRLLPTGYPNYKNPSGIRYYNDLINELIKNGIEPIITLYHWDLPQNLQLLGGWVNLKMANYFEDYANAAFELFGDRVKKWITFNDPSVICEAGYGRGLVPPLINASGIGDYMCGKTVLIAHAKAYHSYKKNFKELQKGSIGISVGAQWYEPKTESIKDVEAAERMRQMSYGWWLHPILSQSGDYPGIMKERITFNSCTENYTQSRLSELYKEEIELIRGSCDFVGLNHYTTKLISHLEFPTNYPTSRAKDISVLEDVNPNWPKSAATWIHTVPWGLRKLLNWIKNEYNNPVVLITENGFGDRGAVIDVNRIHYYRNHLDQLLNALTLDGCNVKAYFAWSMMDSMEWNSGYTIKFGLYQVNFTDPNLKRTRKGSGNFYKHVIQTRRIADVFWDSMIDVLMQQQN